MKSARLRLFSIVTNLIVVIALLAACTPAPAPTAIPRATSTLPPPATETNLPTDKPLPFTDTPAPTATPGPTDTPAPLILQTYPSFADKIGVDLGDMFGAYVEIGWRERAWEVLEPANGCGAEYPEDCAPLDEDGWPMSDARKVVFDLRPWGQWWAGGECPTCPDGDFTPNIWGAYTISFKGKAESVYSAEGPLEGASPLTYDEATNTTTFTINFQKPAGLMFLGFTGTQRTPDSPKGSGFTDFRVTLPGYDPASTQIFTDAYLKALAPFDTLRFMNQIGGNNIDPGFDAADNTLDWAERSTPGKQEWLPKEGSMPWEYVVELANRSGKNIWINIPVHASDDYVKGLAEYLQANLHADATIYIEYSNEVWNSLFTQYEYNKQAALAETAAGNSTLNNDGATDADKLLARRHIRRVMEISNIFAGVYGKEAINQQIRPVYSWFILMQQQYETSLAWLKSTYGDPSQFFYGIAAAGYFNPSRDLREITSPLPNLDVFFKTMEIGSDLGVRDRKAVASIARTYHLKVLMYESGPDNSGQLQWERKDQLMNLFIEGHQDPRMGALVAHDMYNNWWANPDIEGDMYIYFTLLSPWTRWGLWGATRDITDLAYPKYQALAYLAGQAQIAPPIPLGIKLVLGTDSNTLSWAASYGAEKYIILRRKSGGEPTPFAEIAATNFVDTGLDNPNSYIYAVVAVNQYGQSLPSVEVSGAFGVNPTATPRPVIDALQAKEAAAAPAMDGVKDDVWNSATPMQLINHLSGAEDGDVIQVSALWDQDYLYILFEGNDDVVRNDMARGDYAWDDDSVEVYLDGDNAKGTSYDANDDQLVFVVGGTEVWSQRGRGTETEYASTQTETSFIVEIRIPWVKFGVAPAADLVIGFDAMYNDDDNLNQGARDGKWSLYAKTDSAWEKPSVFGEVKLVK